MGFKLKMPGIEEGDGRAQCPVRVFGCCVRRKLGRSLILLNQRQTRSPKSTYSVSRVPAIRPGASVKSERVSVRDNLYGLVGRLGWKEFGMSHIPWQAHIDAAEAQMLAEYELERRVFGPLLAAKPGHLDATGLLKDQWRIEEPPSCDAAATVGRICRSFWRRGVPPQLFCLIYRRWEGFEEVSIQSSAFRILIWTRPYCQ